MNWQPKAQTWFGTWARGVKKSIGPEYNKIVIEVEVKIEQISTLGGKELIRPFFSNIFVFILDDLILTTNPNSLLGSKTGSDGRVLVVHWLFTVAPTKQ